MVSFIIAAEGHVQAADVVRSAIGDPALHECMITVTRGLRFPPPAGPVGVNYPWVFTTEP